MPGVTLGCVPGACFVLAEYPEEIGFKFNRLDQYSNLKPVPPYGNRI
jgi:hypothetical protein